MFLKFEESNVTKPKRNEYKEVVINENLSRIRCFEEDTVCLFRHVNNREGPLRGEHVWN